jgi:tRNA(fMet)-specific endonuclease VapC
LQFPVLEFDLEGAGQAGEARAQPASKGTPIGPDDVLVGGQAKARNLNRTARLSAVVRPAAAT